MPSVPSYERFDYRLRPNKAVQRKLLCEAFRRLALFERTHGISRYRYVGFASPFYADFLLFHRDLGLTAMVNIEQHVEDKARLTFNRPFASIKCRFGKSVDVLPTLSWARRVIVWLDYDGDLNNDTLDDISTVCARARSGSALVLSFRAEARTPEDWVRALDDLQLQFGVRTPTEVLLKGVKVPLNSRTAGEGAYSRALARIATDAIEQGCLDRSGGGRRFLFEQIVDFEYRDGVKMVTVGGILLDESDLDLFHGCHFEQLPFVKRAGSDPFVLQLPFLTLREMAYLEQRIPSTSATWKRIGLKESMAKNYEQVYRWYPKFAETDI